MTSRSTRPAPTPEATSAAIPSPVSAPAGSTREPAGEFTRVESEDYYRISHVDRLPPFLMSLPSDTDLWMFITSRGGLTSGRVDAEGALFPYETVDRLQDSHLHTGPITLARVRRGDDEALWQPFAPSIVEIPGVERSLYKNTAGNRLIFEERHDGLAMMFRYRWSACEEFGHVRTATLTNLGTTPVAVTLLDGFRNVLPFGAPLALYQNSSSLVDAYKRTDLDRDTRLAIFSLTAKIVDRAEAAEELRANTVWCGGLERFEVCLSAEALEDFARGEPLREVDRLTGRRGNYLVHASLELGAGAAATWHMAADVGRDHGQIAALRARLQRNRHLSAEVEDRLQVATDGLVRIVGSADGIQLTGSAIDSAHHFANVLFNCMRGGVFLEHYDLPAADLRDFVQSRNHAVAARHRVMLDSLQGNVRLEAWLNAAAQTGDADLQRLAYEYLPLYFGRRHGDPSRPWNRFAIRVRDRDGRRAMRYEGNWRDIFQNWEALAFSFPGLLPSMIAKFVNASTVDGFNPYRITRDGIDWEIVDPKDPWSHIGYWGDHQIVYLLMLLEMLEAFSPGAIEDLLGRRIFCYADVPYRLRPYRDILADPHETIDFDHDHAARIADRVAATGGDGRLLHGSEGTVIHVNLLEKLIVPALSKLSNLIPDGGIWMNTQRPEWNDANNALVGNGVSMVTLYYLRRYLRFLGARLAGRAGATARISTEVAVWLRELTAALAAGPRLIESATLADRDRRALMDALGGAFSRYRTRVYTRGLPDQEDFPVDEIVSLCSSAGAFLDHAIRANRRADGLYHAYNLLDLGAAGAQGSEAAIRPLYEMLEGQVAALASGAVSAPEAVRLLSALFSSALYRDDQRSFMLYPDRELPGFLERNRLPVGDVSSVALLGDLVAAGDTSVVERDVRGVHHFHADFRNARDLDAALDRLARDPRWSQAVAVDRQRVLQVFEGVFHHHSFTGRSGTMYGYEGLGCIYWHMVAKLLLAVQQVALTAIEEAQPASVVEALVDYYERIRNGLGFQKTVREYGAFPTDPYSHTPRHAGAQQPGMTGQVKEEILIRFGELGVRMVGGALVFRPVLLRASEFRRETGTYRHFDLRGRVASIEVPAGALAFGYCGVPVLYRIGAGGPVIRLVGDDGAVSVVSGDHLDEARSRVIFERRGGIGRIEVDVPERLLRR